MICAKTKIMQNQKGNIILIIVGIIALLAIGGVIGYFVVKKPSQQQEQQKSISEITEQKNQQPEAKDEMADWQYYNHKKEGVSSVALPNFKYPSNWFTINISGGQMIEIIFSDKNIIVGQQNDCEVSITFNGSQNKYSIAEISRKQIVSEKSECDNIISLMKRQVIYY